MCKNPTQVLQWCSVELNRKVRNKKMFVGTKAKIHDKEKDCARERTIEKENHR
jgi:hypothetical protein